MVKTLEETRLWEENRKLRSRLKECLSLIDWLSNLDEPLFEAKLSIREKKDYIRVVSKAKRILQTSD